MLAQLTPSWLRRASFKALACIALASSSPTSFAEAPSNVATLTAEAEQDLAVVTVTYNGVRQEALAYIARLGDSLLIDTDTLRRLAIRYDSSSLRSVTDG